jgi:hypothetical protein
MTKIRKVSYAIHRVGRWPYGRGAQTVCGIELLQDMEGWHGRSGREIKAVLTEKFDCRSCRKTWTRINATSR